MALDVLQDNLGRSQVPFSQLGPLMESCQQQPCLVRIAGRALAQGCITLQDIISPSLGELASTSNIRGHRAPTVP